MRQIISEMPFADAPVDPVWGQPAWPGGWVAVADAADRPMAAAYRLRFHIDQPITARVHVSGDERYALYLDGERIGRGPERGDPLHWRFESYDLTLEPGEHVLAAWVNSAGHTGGRAPSAQMTLAHGFLLLAEDPHTELLSTGIASWEGKRLGGITWLASPDAGSSRLAGGFERIDAAGYDWGFERGEGDGWQAVKLSEAAPARSVQYGEDAALRRLTPATLPTMLDRPAPAPAVRQARAIDPGTDDDALRGQFVDPDAHDPGLADTWTTMLAGGGAVQVEPNRCLRLILDLGDYRCAYPALTVTGGAGACVRLHWAEALYEAEKTPQNPRDPAAATPSQVKGDRDTVAGKLFHGKGDTFVCDGGSARRFEPMWWRAGRYVELIVRTADQPLTVDALVFQETHYPLELTHRLDTGDDRLTRLQPILERGMLMCMHETYMDCPYYEQLMYIGDTRVETLVTFVLSEDDRLPRKAVRTFAQSHRAGGLTAARYPSMDPQVMPPFSLWWVCMVHDLALWRGGRGFVAAQMPAVRSVIETYLAHRNGAGLIGPLPGWNFVDWVPGWAGGAGPDAQAGVNGTINWQAVYTLRHKAELEDWLSETELAARDRRTADQLAAAATDALWDDSRGLFADDLSRDHFSEHTQCLALLAGVGDDKRQQRCLDGLLSADGLARTTIYFSFYLLETLAHFGRMDAFFDKLREWDELLDLGLKTPLESPEPTRSDCHAWGSHPLFHLHASVLGLRPGGFGFDSVTITPRLGPLQTLRTTTPTPRGPILADLHRDGNRLAGQIILPDGLTGQLHLHGDTAALVAGTNAL